MIKLTFISLDPTLWLAEMLYYSPVEIIKRAKKLKTNWESLGMIGDDNMEISDKINLDV